MKKNNANSTIIDIARRANVTNITVSRVFNQPHLVKPETREKILTIAKELNYVPNAFAQGLKKNSSRIIGVVTSSTYNPFYSHLIQTVSRIARNKGYQIMLFDTDDSESAESLAIQTLFSYQACGILLSAVRDDKNYSPSYLDLADVYRIPLVLIDRDIYGKKLNGVFLNNIEIGVRAGRFLAEQPEQRLLIVGGPEDSEITKDRVAGIMGALINNNNKQVKIIHGGYKFDSQEQVLRDMLSAEECWPQYIVGLNGVITLGAMSICHQLHIYDQVKFFSIDKPPYCQSYGQHIPGIYHDTVFLGEKAAEILFRLIETSPASQTSLREYVPGELTV
ncbi:LacI family DNA-binding transcriptional regulator [Martelella alba]|uniref:LacI family transcriptional regulator n=1 Tax=Martelella alba TaxID=2590451 RepID=A0ABY2SIM3_9HYPH|nr:LacI family DNA-binding transcriptional regulator [Martelella alba]TKI04979.1 LacI family transcriptional regulator [Martelella alba]